MINPLKFIQEVKQEAFKVTWPTSKETLQGTLMVIAMAEKLNFAIREGGRTVGAGVVTKIIE